MVNSILTHVGTGIAGAALAATLLRRPAGLPEIVRVRDGPRVEVALRTEKIKWVAPSVDKSTLYVCAKPDGCYTSPGVPDKFVVRAGDRSYGVLRSRFVDALE